METILMMTMLAETAEPLLPGGWVVGLVSAAVSAAVAGAAGWNKGKRSAETVKIKPDPLRVTPAKVYVTAETCGLMHRQLVQRLDSVEKDMTAVRRILKERDDKAEARVGKVYRRLESMEKGMGTKLNEMIRAVGRLEGKALR